MVSGRRCTIPPPLTQLSPDSTAAAGADVLIPLVPAGAAGQGVARCRPVPSRGRQLVYDFAILLMNSRVCSTFSACARRCSYITL
ncbi:hypothetical protein QF048_004441 [Streptomyces sp. W4I9-2]|nr:hypothetical protein [Streptomyces sp. W4I9-2]